MFLDVDERILKPSKYEPIDLDQTGEPIIIEEENILDVPLNNVIDEYPVFEEDIKTPSRKRKQPPRSFIPKKTLMNNDNKDLFEPPTDQPISCKYEHCGSYLYKSEMIDGLYCTYECKNSDFEQLEDSMGSIIVELEEYTNIPKITIINDNRFFESLEKTFKKRKQPSTTFQPNKIVMTSRPDNLEEPSKPPTNVKENNDYKHSGVFDHCTPILCKNKSCGAYLFKPELFDNSYCTFECKKLDLEQPNQSVISLKDISHVSTKSMIFNQNLITEKPFRKRKQPLDEFYPNKMFLTKSWVENQKSNLLCYRPSTDVKKKDDNTFDGFASLQNRSTKNSLQIGPQLLEHMYCSVEIEDVESENKELVDLEETTSHVIKTDSVKNCDGLDQLENFCRNLTIDENHSSSSD